MKSLKKFLLFAICFLSALIIGLILGSNFKADNASSQILSFNFNKNNKINKILNLVRTNYVDSIDVDSLEDLAIADILKNLDPHSVYLAPIKAKQQSENLEGNFEGIGIEYYLLTDTLLVTNVRDNGPSAKAGLLKGDKIIAVNGESLTGKGLMAYNVINKLKGKKGSPVEVSYLRNNNLPKKLSIVRDKIEISSIDAAYLINENTGYIKISRFGANTDQDFITELDLLINKGAKSLILDLRGNGGGYLNAATSIADQFLTENKIIVYTKGLHEPRTDYFSSKDGIFKEGKLAILIDEGTASASEIVAGAVQDLDRGLIIGRRSFGKGLVQEQFSFDDGSAMNLTIARYFTPSGRSIQKPYEKGLEEYNDDLHKRFEKGEYLSVDSIIADSAFSFKKVFKTAKGRNVYEGGGIMPDFFVPLDTSYYTSVYRKINEKNAIQNFVYRNLINNVNTFSYKSSKDFYQNYIITDELFNRFTLFIKKEGISFNDKELKKSTPKIKKEIKAILARYYFKDEGFYMVVNNDDPTVVKALTEIKKLH